MNSRGEQLSSTLLDASKSFFLWSKGSPPQRNKSRREVATPGIDNHNIGCRGDSASIGAEKGGDHVRRRASSLELLRSRMNGSHESSRDRSAGAFPFRQKAVDFSYPRLNLGSSAAIATCPNKKSFRKSGTSIHCTEHRRWMNARISPRCRNIACTVLTSVFVCVTRYDASRGPHLHVRDGAVHDHARANGRCRGPHDPNILRAIASLRDSGRSADASSMPLHTEDAPNVPGPTCNGDSPVTNILRSKRSRRRAVAKAPHRRSRVARYRCTPKSASAQNSGRR